MSDKAKRVIRTVIQSAAGLAAGLPLIVGASGVPLTATGVGVVLAVAAGLTRIMALPLVEGLLDHVGLGLGTVTPVTAAVPPSPGETATQ